MVIKQAPSKWVCVFWLLSAMLISSRAAMVTPTILITNLPAYGVAGNLSGFVAGASPASNAVAIYIYVPSYGWVTKPTCAQPVVPIQPDGSWSADVSTGGAGDLTATRFAALVVATNYSLPCVLGLANLPTNAYSQALAKTVVTRPSPGVRFLNFSGYDWWVKTSSSPVGPGPNIFSDHADNVWTDTNGWLHLRITHRSNIWQSAELVSSRTFGPGNYRFELNSPADELDPNVTLGLFTWSDDPAFTYREIDVECSRWQNAADTNNAQFVVQPYYLPNQLVRYRVPPGQINSTHVFVWETNRISFLCQTGAYSPSGHVISSYVFTNASAVPQSGDENVRMNLWLINGSPPTDGNEVEVIIKSFNFVPLGMPPQAALARPRLTEKQFQCNFTVHPDFRYQIQTATDLGQWTNLLTFLATNSVLTFADTNVPTAHTRFYRGVTLP